MMRRPGTLVGMATLSSICSFRNIHGNNVNIFDVSDDLNGLEGKAKPSDNFGREKQEIPPGPNSGTKYNEKGYIKYSGDVPGGRGPSNRPGVYEKPTEAAYFAKGEKGAPDSSNLNNPIAPTYRDMSDNIKYPEHRTSAGMFEHAPPASHTGGRQAMQYHGMKPNEVKDTVSTEDIYDYLNPTNLKDHHPDFDYTNKTGRKEGWVQGLGNIMGDMELRRAKMSLYRCCLKALPLLKQQYWLDLTPDQMKEKVRDRFMLNRYVRDEDAIRHLMYMGWIEYTDIISLKRPRAAVQKYLGSLESEYDLQKIYAEQEGRAIQDRALWNGEEQRKEGSWDGHWSWVGKETARQHELLKGRVPVSWKVSKGFFDKWVPDGTNAWEKNLDYEGWMVNNVDPDRHAARKELSATNESNYHIPKHYLSKNRRAYRRMVSDLESVLTDTPEETWAKSREVFFQHMLRDRCPETNRVDAERKLARMDDEFYGTKHDEREKILKQLVREFPNPRMWKTDVFFFRMRQLSSVLEFNWSKAPIGRVQEKAFNEFQSDNANYAVLNSKQFAEIKADKSRNPMAQTWAEFYVNFDPDVPSTRNLPWYHPEFNYDRRWHWDELCVRRKKWAISGEIDAKRPFFDALIHEAQLNIHRDDRIHDLNNAEKKYMSPRTVQLYRSFNRRLDAALAVQMRAVVEKSSGKSTETLSKMSADDVEALIAKTDFTKFKFDVPVFIYPDGYKQAPSFRIDGSEIPAEPVVEEEAAEVSESA